MATGIGTVAVSLLALIGFAALFAFFWWLTRPKPQVARPQKRGLAGRRFPRWWPWLSPLHILLVSLPMAVVAGYLFWSIPVFDVLIVLAGAVNSFFAFEYRKLGRRGAMLFVAVYFGIALGANIASAFVYPKPLPEARLVLRGGNSVVGGLIARDGGTWFVTTKPKTYRALPADRIVTAIVRSRKRAEEPTPVLKALWRWISG